MGGRGDVLVYFIPVVNVYGVFHSSFLIYLLRSVTNVQMLNLKEMVISSPLISRKACKMGR